MVVAGCDLPSTEQVGPVQLDVPGRWVVDDDTDGERDVLLERRWRPDDGQARVLQVLVGCGEGDAEDLREALGETYQVHEELRSSQVEVAGLDSAQRVALALTDDPFGEAAGGVLLDGLYGAGSGGLVIVELGAAEDEHDPGIAEEVLGSVEVDAQQLAERCSG